MDFQPWPKTPRLRREVTITEKIDGTNACVIIEPLEKYAGRVDTLGVAYVPLQDVVVGAQSRKRLITPQDDNMGFARWVWEHAETLVADLGVGRHFGEWWGQGIQRGYGLDHKRFSLFNSLKWGEAQQRFATPNLDVVPEIYRGQFSDGAVDKVLAFLADFGSEAADRAGGKGKAEGVIVYHRDADRAFKVLLENDSISKTAAGVR